MKKLFLVLALVAAYGVSMANSNMAVKSVNVDQVTVVADVDNNNAAEPEKEKAKTKEAKAAKSEGCATAKSEGCATAKSEGCGDKAKAEKTEKNDNSK